MATADDGTMAAKRMRERAKRLKNLAPALKVFAEEIHKATDDAFDQSRDTEGRSFAPLKPATLKARDRHARRRKAQARLRAQIRKAQKLPKPSEFEGPKLPKMEGPKRPPKPKTPKGPPKPLVDTARARNSQRAKVHGRDGVRWSAVKYLGPHMTGFKTKSATVPQRNPTVFDLTRSGKTVRLKQRFRDRMTRLVTAYIETGKAA